MVLLLGAPPTECGGYGRPSNGHTDGASSSSSLKYPFPGGTSGRREVCRTRKRRREAAVGGRSYYRFGTFSTNIIFANLMVRNRYRLRQVFPTRTYRTWFLQRRSVPITIQPLAVIFGSRCICCFFKKKSTLFVKPNNHLAQNEKLIDASITFHDNLGGILNEMHRKRWRYT